MGANWRIGDQCSFRGDTRARITGRVLDKTVRVTSSGRVEVTLRISGANGKIYVRTASQVKPT